MNKKIIIIIAAGLVILGLFLFQEFYISKNCEAVPSNSLNGVRIEGTVVERGNVTYLCGYGFISYFIFLIRPY